jgi:hypothetical protein
MKVKESHVLKYIPQIHITVHMCLLCGKSSGTVSTVTSNVIENKFAVASNLHISWKRELSFVEEAECVPHISHHRWVFPF